MKLKVRRNTATAILPKRAEDGAAAYDLYSDQDVTIPAPRADGDRVVIAKALVSTGVSLEIPEGFYGRVGDRSSLSAKHGLHTGAGILDRSYRGTVYVLLFNLGAEDYHIRPGDRIAQLVLERNGELEVEEVAELSATSRGAGGFGSTGR